MSETRSKSGSIEESRVASGGQMQIFPRRPDEYCRSIGLNWLAAASLFEEGYLSFDPRKVDDMDDVQAAELAFIGSLVGAGCDCRFLDRLVEGLRKPYAYRIEEVYYDWNVKQWRRFPWLDENEFDAALDCLIEEEDESALESALNRIQEALDSLREEE